MKDCEICGNEIQDTEMTCRFCGSPQSSAVVASPRERIGSLNVKAGLPSTDEGLARLESGLSRARGAGVRVVRVIHGWGSSGSGGLLRSVCRAFLARELRTRKVRSVVHGEDYSRSSVAGRELMARWPELKSTERTDSANPGITFVEL